MAIETISTINEVCGTSVNPDRIEIDIFFYGSPRLGMILYTDEPKTIRKGAGIWGLKYNNKIYKVRTDSMGIVVQFDGECVANELPTRLIAYQVLNVWEIPNGNIGLLKEQIDEMLVAGANCFHIAINLDYIFNSNSELIANSESKWAGFDEFFAYVAAKNKPVGIRVNMGVDDSLIESYWGWANHQKDEWGFDCRIAYGSGITSFAYTAGRNMLLDFFTKVVNRYYPVFGNNLIFIQPSLTAQQEFGGNYENRQYPEPNYPCIYDYSENNKSAFRTAMQAKYSTIGNLKVAWGSVANSYTSFSDVMPPTSGLSNRFESNWAALRNGLSGKRGEDWWKFGFGQYYDFMVDCKNILQSVNSQIELSGLWGSASDELSLARYSFNLAAFCTVCDNIQTECSTRNFSNSVDSISTDWVNSLSTKKKYSEVASFDAGGWQNALEYCREGLKNGLSMISIVVSKNYANLDEWNAYKGIIATLVEEYEDKPIVTVATEGTISVELSQCIRDWEGVVSAWRNAGGGKNKRILINFNNDL